MPDLSLFSLVDNLSFKHSLDLGSDLSLLSYFLQQVDSLKIYMGMGVIKILLMSSLKGGFSVAYSFTIVSEGFMTASKLLIAFFILQ